MPNEQLVAYIRQNMAAGALRADIERALIEGGWNPNDVRAAISAIDNPQVVAAPAPGVPAAMQSPQSPAPADSNAAETARIQKELELEAKRHKWHGVTASTPVVGGIIGWMVAKKFAHDEVQANLILIGMSVIAIGLTVWISWPHGSKGGPLPAQLEASIKAMQAPHP